MTTRLLIHGVYGKMGQALAQRAVLLPGVLVAAGVDYAKSDASMDFPVYPSLEDVREEVDVAVDFSAPGALSALLAFAKARRIGLVLATTGYSADDLESINSAAAEIPIFRSANMSLGVNLMLDLLGRSAAFFGAGIDVEIVERHHRTKVDSPSGTALMLADEINGVFQGGKHYVYERHSMRQKRDSSQIGIASVRGGTVVGEHDVSFLGDDEILTISHVAQSRAIFATGALRASQYLTGKPPKLYQMKDLLLENSAVTHMFIDRDVARVTLDRLAGDAVAEAFRLMAELDIVLDMISQTAPLSGGAALSFSMASAELQRAAKALSKAPCGSLTTEDGLTKLTVQGLGMERQSGVAARVFTLLNQMNVAARMVTTSQTEISLLLERGDEARVVAAINAEFGI